ncbi:hypothetical protein I551_7252 [Mycobacterium ulcerans str. Harvey]|uniref:Uncharacterized protein n=1 Tax=Mycobacterium ulcerans str. Harvey TaxID=1299332 RepID=A0ABP3A3Y0_MYCUL|nr:hypothetical protein I551_7252 [Mycobacterium ulcerans str. Harvey]
MLACSKRRRPSRFVFQDPMGLDTNLAEVGRGHAQSRYQRIRAVVVNSFSYR